MKRQNKNSLANAILFEGFSAEAIAEIEGRCRWQSFEPHEQIIAYLDTSDDVYFVVSGKARVIIYSVDGKAVAFRDMHPGDMFGELAAIDSRPRSASIEALDSCVLASMSSSDFRNVLETEPSVTRALLKHLIEQIRVLTSRVYEFSTLAVNNRIHAELLRLARSSMSDDGAARIAPMPTHAEIASRISTHREAVTREIGRLADIGLVERGGTELRVTDVARLARMVQEATGE